MNSERLHFRHFIDDDWPAYWRMMSDELIMKYIMGRSLTHEEAKKRFENLLSLNQQHPHIGYYILHDTVNQLAGLAKLEYIDQHSVEVGYCLMPNMWGKGLATEITLFLTSYARELSMYSRIIAYVNPENSASSKVLLKCGYRYQTHTILKDRPTDHYVIQL